MKVYDPERALDPFEWNALDESERHDLVRRYHRKQRIKIPSLQAHTAIHVIVENQVALGKETPVQRTLERLMLEGLSRHNAVHAIGSVLASCIYDIINDDVKDQDVNAMYYHQLGELTAESWLKSDNEELDDEDLE